MTRAIFILTGMISAATVLSITTDAPVWGWLAFIFIAALGAILATAAAGKGRP